MLTGAEFIRAMDGEVVVCSFLNVPDAGSLKRYRGGDLN